MKFSKFHGAGNDFIILNNIEEQIPVEHLGRVARCLCRRRFSLGADGLMAVEKPEQGGDYRMLYFNSDGSLGEMCGNGARCIARYGYETGLAGETQKIETTAGLVIGKRIDRRMYQIRLNDPTKVLLSQRISIAEKTYEYSYVELGDPGIPHIAVEYPDFWEEDEGELKALGRKLRNYKDFPKGSNVNFFAITGPDQIRELTYERGVEDFTLACGTGTGSVVAALTLLGRVSGQDVKVKVPGGLLSVTAERQGDKITGLFLTGPTNIVAQGELTDEDFWERFHLPQE